MHEVEDCGAVRRFRVVSGDRNSTEREELRSSRDARPGVSIRMISPIQAGDRNPW